MQPPETVLRSACSALGLAVSEPQVAQLLAYLALLERWNATYNLTAVRDPAAMLTQHLADCLTVVPPFVRYLAGRAGDAGDASLRVLDVGSGGGLPAAVLATMLHRCDVTSVDAVGKKAAFVRQVAGALGLPNLHAVHGRVERLNVPPFDVITARAFASLAALVSLTKPALAPGGCWAAMKGRHPEEEIAALPADVVVFHVEPLVVPGLDAQRCLVWMQRAP